MRLLTYAFLVLAACLTPAHAQGTAADPQNTLVIELKTGKVLIRLRPDLAPKHIARVKELAQAGFYDGIVFHRVIAGFMAQTGDPTGTGRGGSGRSRLPAEFNATAFGRGTVGAARGPDPNSADSQFFICLDAAPHLNGDYTAWGQVIEGMDHVDRIAKGQPPANPDRMLKVYLLADAGKR